MENQHDRIRDIFIAAVEKPAAERDAFLDQACLSHPELRKQVERLLEADGSTDSFFANANDGPVPRFSVGRILAERFRVVRHIAAGGMGDVYEVEDIALNARLALKTIRSDLVGDEIALARFKREIQCAKQVTHPNVCRIHDLGSHREGQTEILFLTMELLRGETLARRLRATGRISPPDALPLVVQMAEGLSAAHEAGVIHRDFKTSNVILTGRGTARRAVVTDFGLALPNSAGDEASLTQSGVVMGTPAYMAPEQLTRGDVTPATDVYALGLVIYEMTTGMRPFPADTPIASALKRLTDPPPRASDYVPGFDPRWEAAIVRCLEREPARRFQNPKDVIHALTETSAPTRTLTGHFVRKKRPLLGIAAIAGVALVAALAGVWTFGRHRPPAAAVRWYEEGTRALRDGVSFTAMNALEKAVQLDPDFSLAHGRLAEAATDLDYMDKAKTEMLRATPPAFQSFFLSAEEKLRLEAVYFVLVRDFVKAAAKYKELAAKVASEERPAVLVDLGRAYEGGSKFPEALSSYSESIELDRQFPAAFLRRAVLEGRQQMNAKATADFDAAEQLYRTEVNTEGLIEVLYQRALLLRRLGRFTEARTPCQAALDMARASNDEYHQIKALLALSDISYSSGDTDGGQQQAQQAIDLARRAGIDVLAASGLADIGNALFTKGDNEAAEPYLRNAIESAKRFQAVRIEARAQLALGQLLAKQGRTHDGLVMIEEATENYRQSGDKNSAARAAIIPARAFRDRGDYEAAASLFRRQLQVAEEVKDDGGIVLAVQGLGSVLLLQEQYPAALAQYDRSALVSHAIKNQLLEAYNEVYRADTLWRLGRYGEADDSLTKAVQRSNGNKPLIATVYTTKAGLDLSRRSFPAAEEDIQRVTEAAGAGSEIVLKRLLGLVRIATGRIREGRALCEESVRYAEAATNIPSLRNSELALAEGRLAAGDATGALELTTILLPYFAGQNQLESELRTLAVASSASHGAELSRYSDSAKATLEKLRQNLGADHSGFESRPDIRQITRNAGLISDTK
jgi:tetratricopeptide (TPR) repeat protein/tRNA A-37 threonylcarbamoyl transferase component Bud32